MKTYEVTMRTVAKATLQVDGNAHDVAKRVRATLPAGAEILSIIQTDPPLNPDYVCQDCEALRVKAEKEPEPPPKGAPPTGRPTGGTEAAFLRQEAA